MRINLDPNDSLFSKMVRERDGWRCQFCLTQYEPPTKSLQCSHFWGRGMKTTRFDPLNCDALCYGCHARHEGNKQGFYEEWKLNQLGRKALADLERRARSVGKYGAYEKKLVRAELKRQYAAGEHLKPGWEGVRL